MKRLLALFLMICMVFTLVACGNSQTPTEPAWQTDPSTDVTEASTEEPTVPETTAAEKEYAPLSNGMSGNPNDYDASVPATNILRNEVQDLFTQEVFEDSETGLSLDFNLFLPENYDNGEKYPLVIFMSDSSLVGKAVNAPVIQCRGAMVWATATWQEEHPCIIAVPQFNDKVIDDNNGTEVVSEYVAAVRNLILSLSQQYPVDTDRIYGMGQSMGCMVTMYLCAQYEDLYAACLFVDGQWNIEQLEGLKDRKFIYFAAEGDAKASAGMAEVKEMLSSSDISYSEVVWNAKDDQALLNDAALEMLSEGNDINFVSWLIGSVVGKPGEDGGMREHMASFDYAFRQSVLREWLFMQHK